MSNLSYMKVPLLAYAGEIRCAVLVVHGEKAHSCYMGEDAFKAIKGDNKELMIISGAVHTEVVHTDLYDNKAGVIPHDRMEAFFDKNLK